MSRNCPTQGKAARRPTIASALGMLIMASEAGCEQSVALAQADAVSNTIDQSVPKAADPLGDSKATDPPGLMPQYAVVTPLTPEAKADRLALAEEVANPIANLASLPLRFTYQS